MSSKFLSVFLLLALVVLAVNAQNATETNVIDACIKRENCAPADRDCRAACAGVPDPDPQHAIDTQTCYNNCSKEHLPDDIPAYKECTKKCREDVYQEGITGPGSSSPSKKQKDDSKDSGASDSNGTDSESNGNTSDDGNGTGDGNSTEKDGGASFSAKSVHVYVLAAVLACVAFTVGL